MQKYTLITWCTSWIWYELSKIFVLNWHNVLIVWRDENKLNDLNIQLSSFKKNISIKIFCIDLSKIDSAEKIYEFCKNNNIEVDILVNNAWIWVYWNFYENALEKIEQLLILNIMTLVKLTKLFLVDFKKKDDWKILNIWSIAWFFPWPYMSIYYASKSFVMSFSEWLKQELNWTNISISLVCPWPVDTNFKKNANMDGIRLFEKKQLPSAQDIAIFSYNKLMKKQFLCIPWIINNFISFLPRILPRSIVAKIIKYMNKKINI